MIKKEYEVSLGLKNIQIVPVDFILEPCGRSYTLEPDATWVVVFQSSMRPVGLNSIEVEYGVDSITVYGWQGCIVDVLQGGEEIPSEL